MTQRILAIAVLILVGSSILARAEQTPLDAKPNGLRTKQTFALPRTVPIRIEVAGREERHRMLIPRKMLADLQIASLEHSPPVTGSTTAWPPVSMIGLSVAAMAGFSLLAGLRCPSRYRSLVLLALLTLVPGILNIALATPAASQRTDARQTAQPVFLQDFELSGPVMVEVVETGDAIRLILSRNVPLRYKSR